MKFSIENINIKTNSKEDSIETVLKAEDIEKNIERFCYEVLVKEQEVGVGNYGWVYKDTHENGLCYKKFQPGAENRMNITAFSEMQFLEAAHGVNSDVKTPFPVGFAEVLLKNEAEKKRLVKVIAMEYFDNSTKLEDVIEPRSEDLKADLPESFNPQLFFDKLEDFVIRLHEEKGIYHRDLHSRNILIDNETGDPIVIDFGDASYPSLDEKYDAYGRPIYGNENKEDLDLKNVRTLREKVGHYIDKSK